MYKKYSEAIYATSLLMGIERNNIDTMLECLSPRVCCYNKNDFIVNAGDDFVSIGIMLKGEAVVIKENAAGSKVIMSILREADIFGEMVAFSSQSKWPAAVQAQSSCEVMFLPRNKIIGECNKLCPWHRTMIQNFLKILSERALMLNRKVEYLTIKSIRGKISNYLLEQYKSTGNKNIMLPLNRNELADFLDISRPSMSREMCKMRDDGVIDFHLSAVRILDIEALVEMSNL